MTIWDATFSDSQISPVAKMFKGTKKLQTRLQSKGSPRVRGGQTQRLISKGAVCTLVQGEHCGVQSSYQKKPL